MNKLKIIFHSISDDKREPSAWHYITVCKNNQKIISCRTMIYQFTAAWDKLKCPSAEHHSFSVQMSSCTAQIIESMSRKSELSAVLSRRNNNSVKPELICSDILAEYRQLF